MGHSSIQITADRYGTWPHDAVKINIEAGFREPAKEKTQRAVTELGTRGDRQRSSRGAELAVSELSGSEDVGLPKVLFSNRGQNNVQEFSMDF
jgi:hypothetical protein